MGGECFEPKEGRAAGPDSECGKDGPEASRNTSSPGTAVSGVWAGCCGIHAGPHRFVFELVLCSGSVDGDGCHELVVGHTDRVVRAFRWEDLGEGTDHPTGQLVSLKKWTLEGQVRGPVWGQWGPGSRGKASWGSLWTTGPSTAQEEGKSPC